MNNSRRVSPVHEPVNCEVSDAVEGVEDEAVVVLEVLQVSSGLEGLGEIHVPLQTLSTEAWRGARVARR